MNTKARKKRELLAGGLLVAVNVLLFNVLLGNIRLFRLDLTEGQIYTLSDVTREMLQDLEDPVTIRFYYSSREAQHDLIRPLIEPMKDILEEFGAEGGDKVRVVMVELDTAGKKAQEDAANRFGVRPLALPVKTTFEAGVKSSYFSLVIEANGAYEEMDLQSNFSELCRYVSEGSGTFGGRFELADIEYLVAKTIHRLTRTFNSVPAALVAHDQRAKVLVFVSEDEQLPEYLKGLEGTVKKVTETMARQSEGRLEVHFESPLKGAKGVEEITKIARPLYEKYGVRPVEKRDGNGYFYASIVVQVGDQHEVVDFLGMTEPGESDVREAIEGALKPLIPGFLPVIGFSAPGPPPMNPMMMRQQPPNEFGLIERALGRDFQVEKVNLTGESPRIPPKVGVLVLIRPAELSEEALFALDQFVMRGGRLVVLVDNHHLDLQRAQFGDALPVKTETTERIRELLAHYGAKVGTEVIEDERAAAVAIPVIEDLGGLRLQRMVPIVYPPAILLDEEGLARDHPITASITLLDLFWASPVQPENVPEGVKATVIASTSDKASLRASVPSVRTYLGGAYEPPEDARQYPVMLVLQGRFPSYFADRPIPGLGEKKEAEKDKTDGEAQDDGEKAAAADKEAAPQQDDLFKGAPLKRSKETSIVVIGDSDFVSPFVMESVGRDVDALIEPRKLVKNAIDFGGSDAIILSIRNRAPAVRPLKALAKLTPEERKQSGVRAAWITTTTTFAAVVFLALGWTALRRRRRPLVTRRPRNEGEKAA